MTSPAKYTLKYYTPNDPDPGGVPFEDHSDTLAGSLATAWVNQRAGGRAAGIVYKNRMLLDNDAVERALKVLSDGGAQPGVSPAEIAEQVVPEILADRILELEQVSTGCLGEAAVYRELLETCYKAATQASDSGEVSYLHTVMRLHNFDVPGEQNARSWGKDFVYAYSRDAAWLAAAKRALERIKIDLEKLLAEKDSPDDELKEILKTAEDGLIPHIYRSRSRSVFEMSSPSETLEDIRKGTSNAPFLTSEQEWRVGVMLNRLQRAALSRKIRGKYAHLPTSSENFAARKADEIALEERSR